MKDGNTAEKTAPTTGGYKDTGERDFVMFVFPGWLIAGRYTKDGVYDNAVWLENVSDESVFAVAKELNLKNKKKIREIVTKSFQIGRLLVDESAVAFRFPITQDTLLELNGRKAFEAVESL